MTALSKNKQATMERWGYRRFTLAEDEIAYVNGRAALDLATGEVVAATGANGQLSIGTFAEAVDATGAAKQVNVRFPREIEVEWFANGSSIAAADVGKICYVADDATVTLAPTGTVAGRIWAVSSADGVAVEALPQAPQESGILALPAFDAGAIALTEVAPGGIYALPATAANSTITLPEDPPDGIEATFLADGTLNGHTVTYRDGTGPTAITAALTASKRHVCRVFSAGGLWHALTTVSP